MGCFRQMFRCLSAPFKREKGRIIEIGHPTDFKKMPVCFSDAESVLSPYHNTTERSDLTTQSQDPDLARQSHGDRGERRNNDRDDAAIIVDKEQGSRSCPQDERETVTKRIRRRMNVSRWWNSTPTIRREQETEADMVSMERNQSG